MVRIEAASEYGLGDGFVIEQLRHWNFGAEETWAIPAWEEMGLCGLEGPFQTKEMARRALASHGLIAA